MKRSTRVIWLLALTLPMVVSADQTVASVSTLDFGAIGDSHGDNTSRLQDAVDEAVRLQVPLVIHPGIYITGPLFVRGRFEIQGWGQAILKAKGKQSSIFDLRHPDGFARFLSISFDERGISDNDSAAIRQSADQHGDVIISSVNFRGISLKGNVHAVMLNARRAYVDRSFADGGGGDAFNFNNGIVWFTRNRVIASRDGCAAFNNNAKGIVIDNQFEKCNLGVGAGPDRERNIPKTEFLIILHNSFEQCNIGINMGWFQYENRMGPEHWVVGFNEFSKTRSVAVNYDGDNEADNVDGRIVSNTITGTGYENKNNSQTFDIRVLGAGGITIFRNKIRSPLGRGDNGIRASGRAIDIVNNTIESSGVMFAKGIDQTGIGLLNKSSNEVSGALVPIEMH